MKSVIALMFAVLVAAIAAGSATAATRYASPTGVPSVSCPQLSPCDLLTAVNSTADGDEVIVLTGTYNLATNAANELGETAANNVVIHGESPTAPPLLKIAPTNVARGIVVDNTVTLRDLRISYEGINASTYALDAEFLSAVDRVHVEGGPHANAACSIYSSVTVTNSACIARDTNAIALQFWITVNSAGSPAHESVVRNSTFVATGTSGYATRIYAGNSGAGSMSMTLRAHNSIFEATGAGSNDAALTTQNADELSELIAQNSNFSSVTTSGPGTENATATALNGNQSVAPLMTDLTAGDVTQAAGSPTIDAGADDPANGTLDLAGLPRTAGARTDIGAYEVQPASPPTPAYALSGASIKPGKFRAAAKGFTLRPVTARPKTKRGQKPIGSVLKFQSTDAGEFQTHGFRVLKGRKSGSGKCGKPSRANRRGKRCSYHKRLPGFISHPVAAGANEFYFTGRWDGRKLRPGRYLMVLRHAGKGAGRPSPTAGEAGVTKRSFTIAR